MGRRGDAVSCAPLADEAKRRRGHSCPACGGAKYPERIRIVCVRHRSRTSLCRLPIRATNFGARTHALQQRKRPLWPSSSPTHRPTALSLKAKRTLQSALAKILSLTYTSLPSAPVFRISSPSPLAPIVQRIEQRFPEPPMQVRFLLGAPR